MLYQKTGISYSLCDYVHGERLISHVIGMFCKFGKIILANALIIVSISCNPLISFADDKTDDCGVVFHEISSIKLVSEIADLPLTLVNTCDYDIIVNIDAVSDDRHRLTVQNVEGITLKSNYSSSVALPVHAKANGSTNITIHISSNNADWGEYNVEIYSVRYIGGVLSILFVLVLVALVSGGIYRTYKRRKHTL